MDLGPATLFVTVAGSQAHGTAGPESDIDLRGVCVAPLRARVSYRETFEQVEGLLPDALWPVVRARLEQHLAAWRPEKKVESVIFDITKLVRLCAAGNPNALEIVVAARARHHAILPQGVSVAQAGQRRDSCSASTGR